MPRLVRLATSEVSSFLSSYIAFKDDDRFEELRRRFSAAWRNVPAYQLAYDSDPATACHFFRIC